jgi:8-oxo-dGTP pyrophosphatase MutT (NUDIX family)
MEWLVKNFLKTDAAFAPDYFPTANVLANREKTRQKLQIQEIGTKIIGRGFAYDLTPILKVWVSASTEAKRELLPKVLSSAQEAGFLVDTETGRSFGKKPSQQRREYFVWLNEERIKQVRELHKDYSARIEAAREYVGSSLPTPDAPELVEAPSYKPLDPAKPLPLGWVAKHKQISDLSPKDIWKSLFPEDPLPKKKFEKWISAGCVIFPSLKDLDHVYVIKPANNFGPVAFPKGKVDKGESQEQAAVREVKEETGLVVSILPGSYLGKAEGSSSFTHFYVAVQRGGALGNHDKEVEWVRLVPVDEAFELFRRGNNHRDMDILEKAVAYVDKTFPKRVKP